MSRVLRMLRSRQNVFNLGRQVNGTIDAGTQSGVTRIQHVKFRRKLFKPWNIAGAALIYYGCYHIYTSAIWGPLEKYLDEEIASMSAEERRELEGGDKKGRKTAMDEDEDILSVTLPFTTRIVKQPPYKGDSAEWQAFVKISKDPQLRAKLEDHVCTTVKRLIEKTPILTARCGKEMRFHRKLLNIVYPSMPPPLVMRKVIVVDGISVSVADRPIDSWVHNRITRALYPTALAASLWAFSGALVKQNMEAAARCLGIEQSGLSGTKIDLAMEQVDRKLKEIANSKTFQSPGSPLNPETKPQTPANTEMPRDAASAPKTTSGGSSSGPSLPTPPTTSVDRPLPSDPSALDENRMISARDLYLIKVTQEHTSGPWQKFKQTFGLNWKPPPVSLPPKGSIAIVGLVSYEAPHAWITCEAQMWYDTKAQAFDTRSSRVRVQTIIPKKQSPRR
ncbi:hypothetical protein Micbo1qcDRAFT_201550 [Microdochium bolleyi]|uniref:Uncharacterized protein n=1 Tax=Microdochium bolleyi TaxID=196109 RepID=A0A136JGE6_9PEZI|nr:hypothetical protein Micbo1qcDRAFT_201550 [Microdochium bolleyi]